MKQKSWPYKSAGPQFAALPLIKKHSNNSTLTKPPKIHFSFSNSTKNHLPSSSSSPSTDFSAIPYDVLARIAASFTVPGLKAASLVCREWRDALKPLRGAMFHFKWGKRYKHGHGGFMRNSGKALDSFLKAAALGSALAMVDAGLIYWERGKKEEAIVWFKSAAELGDPSGQCNLAVSYLQANPPNAREATKWLYKASVAGHSRAQYQLALLLHQGQGVEQNVQEAACWYVRAAEGGYIRAMYNASLCFSVGEGLLQSQKLAREWMKRAADRGHSKAQFEHGLTLFSEGDMMRAVVYLELAIRAGETAAGHVKDAITPQLSAADCNRAILLADKWQLLRKF